MALQSTINDTEKFTAYADINGNDVCVYGEKKKSHWKFFFNINPHTRLGDFENIFNETMVKFIKKYSPSIIKINTKFKFKPVTLCNNYNYKYHLERNKIVIEKD